MLPEQIKNFREMVTLKDGAYVLLRALTHDDKDRLMDFYNAVSAEDLQYFRHDVKDGALIEDWCEHLDYSEVLPIIALAKERIVGSATLHFFTGPKRHIGEVRLFLGKDYRKRGLGMKMIRALIDLARKQGLSVLLAEVIAEKNKVVKAFEQLGFHSDCVLDDFFMFPDGDCSDLVIMTMSLRPKVDEF
ncbi:MAG: GNAT family N-acetyltransferase [Chloroflexota bacterium]